MCDDSSALQEVVAGHCGTPVDRDSEQTHDDGSAPAKTSLLVLLGHHRLHHSSRPLCHPRVHLISD